MSDGRRNFDFVKFFFVSCLIIPVVIKGNNVPFHRGTKEVKLSRMNYINVGYIRVGYASWTFPEVRTVDGGGGHAGAGM